MSAQPSASPPGHQVCKACRFITGDLVDSMMKELQQSCHPRCKARWLGQGRAWKYIGAELSMGKDSRGDRVVDALAIFLEGPMRGTLVFIDWKTYASNSRQAKTGAWGSGARSCELYCARWQSYPDPDCNNSTFTHVPKAQSMYCYCVIIPCDGTRVLWRRAEYKRFGKVGACLRVPFSVCVCVCKLVCLCVCASVAMQARPVSNQFTRSSPQTLRQEPARTIAPGRLERDRLALPPPATPPSSSAGGSSAAGSSGSSQQGASLAGSAGRDRGHDARDSTPAPSVAASSVSAAPSRFSCGSQPADRMSLPDIIGFENIDRKKLLDRTGERSLEAAMTAVEGQIEEYYRKHRGVSILRSVTRNARGRCVYPTQMRLWDSSSVYTDIVCFLQHFGQTDGEYERDSSGRLLRDSEGRRVYRKACTLHVRNTAKDPLRHQALIRWAGCWPHAETWEPYVETVQQDSLEPAM